MQETTLSKVICFTLEGISLWSGRRRLKTDDLKVQDPNKELPPKDVASLGSKKIIDPKDIADFEAMKKEAHRACAKVGIRFLGGYAIPEDNAKDVAAELDDIATRFASRKSKFLADYDQTVARWVAAHPEWTGMLTEASLDRQDVDSRLNFGWSCFKVVEAASDADSLDVSDPLAKGLKSEVSGLAGQLYREIAKAASEVMEKSLVGRDRVSQKILSPIRTIRGKLIGLSFLDNRVKPLVETIDHICDQLPAAGYIDGLGLSALHGLVFILSSEDRMMSHGQMIVDGKAVQDAFAASAPEFVEVETEDDDLVSAIMGIQEVAQPVSTTPVSGEDMFSIPSVPIQQINPISEAIIAPPPVVKPARSLGLF